MFQYLRRKANPEPVAPQTRRMTAVQLAYEPALPISLKALNELDEEVKQRFYRVLFPPDLYSRFEINPLTWKGPDGYEHVTLEAAPGSRRVRLSLHHAAGARDPFAFIELEDNRFNGIDLNFIILSDPFAPRFEIDVDEEGHDTLFGTARRNLPAEARAMQTGLAPAQIRGGLKASRRTLQQLETFLFALGHSAYYLEPLTYVSAWVFEKRGLAYVSGHQLMDEIHREFQPGGRLERALDGSTSFRRPEQAETVRGRAWAIQDGILDAIDARWDGLRMVKRLGRQAGVNTFPGAVY